MGITSVFLPFSLHEKDGGRAEDRDRRPRYPVVPWTRQTSVRDREGLAGGADRHERNDMTKRLAILLLLLGCSSSATTSAPEREPPRHAEPSREEESPPAAGVAHDRGCHEDADCTPAPACCPAPCTSDVVNQVSGARIAAEVARTCTDEERAHCPSAGSCMTHAYLCVRGECALVMEGSPDYHARP